MSKIIGIKKYLAHNSEKLEKFISPHSELGMVPYIQDIARWNGSSYEQVEAWLKAGQPVYTSFARYEAVLEA